LPPGWPKAVIFDLDGTLVDSAASIARALTRVRVTRGGAPVQAQQIRPWISVGARDMVQQVLGTYAADPDADLQAFRAIYSQDIASESELYPGVRDVLARLAGDGRRLAICTNKPQPLAERLLAVLSLDDLFHVVIGGAEGRQPKPHPEMLHLTAQRLGIEARDAVYVGDSETDAEAAARAGLPLIFAEYGYAIGDPAEIRRAAAIGSIPELPSVIRSMAPSLIPELTLS
jgi:phosphoglycolate phosphatase